MKRSAVLLCGLLIFGVANVTYAGGVGTTDTTPPTVSVTAPPDGSSVSGTAVTLSATAADDVGVVGVQFKVDGTNVGAEVAAAPYSVSWNSSTVGSGTHTISAVARDAAGNIATASISVTVAAPALQCTGSTQTISTPGTYTYTVPTYGSMSVTVNGAGGGGGGAAGGGTSGTTSSFNTNVIGNGGGGGGGGNPGCGPLPPGAQGTASGGDTNTTGGGAAGGASGYCGSTGGSGGRAVKAYTPSSLASNSTVVVVVGTGGTAGIGDGPGYSGFPGFPGSVSITCSPPGAAPTCTLSPSSQTIARGDTATFNYTISGSATSASINGASVTPSASGSYTATPSQTTSYTMTVSNSGGTNTCGPVTVTVGQGQSVPITGYAWSDTIGWISLGGTGYGLVIDPNGNLSGYAWSDNIGWVSANSADLTGCPHTPCSAKLQSSALNGWLKALSAGGEGWDGWISLSGSGYGPTVSNTNFSGYSWGSDVVGWVDWSYAHTGYTACTAHYYCSGNDQRHVDEYCADTFAQTCPYQCADNGSGAACIAPPPPAVIGGSGGLTGHLQIAPSLIRSGDTTHVYWDVTNVSSCTTTGTNGDTWTIAGTAGNSWTSTAGTSGETTKKITAQTTYTLSCTGLDNSTLHESATVNILPVFKEI